MKTSLEREYMFNFYELQSEIHKIDEMTQDDLMLHYKNLPHGHMYFVHGTTISDHFYKKLARCNV